jgi:membrane protein required for colicin V production
MHTYDIMMLLVLGLAAFLGAIKGLAWQIASLASIIVSYFLAYQLRDRVAGLIQAEEPWNGFLAMLLVYTGSSFVIWVFFRLISGAIDSMRMRDFDRHMGALLGLGKGALLCLIITLFAVTLLGPRQQQAIVNSRSGAYLSRILAATDGIVWPKEIEPIIRPYLDQVEQRLDASANPNNGAGGFFPGSLAGGQGGATTPGEQGTNQALSPNLSPGNWQLPLPAPGNPVSIPNPFGGEGLNWPTTNHSTDVLPGIR